MIDASNMFENSNFEEIYFGTENESYLTNLESNSSIRRLDENSENITQETTEYFEEQHDSENKNRKEYFDTKKIGSASISSFFQCW